VDDGIPGLSVTINPDTHYPMKVLHVITGLDVGGAETMLHRLATNMDPVRFLPRVVSLIEPGPMGAKLTRAGVPVDCLGMRRGVPSPTALFRLVRIMRDWKPDLVQTWLYHADLIGLLAAKLAFPFGGGPQVAWNIRCSYMALEEYRRLTGVTLKACAALSRFPDAVLTNSAEARRFHLQLGYAPKSFEVIPNGFDTERFKPDPAARREVRAEFNISQDAPVVGQVGRFDVMKDHRTAIHAMASVASQMPDAVFLMVGRGVDDANAEISGWMAEAGLAPDRVRLAGERSDISRLMAAMDVHVSSSIGESFPNAVGEAMACGVPCVVTDVGDSGVLVGDTGLVVLPGDRNALAEAVCRLLKSCREKGQECGNSARNRVIECYSLSETLKKFAEMYEKLSAKAL